MRIIRWMKICFLKIKSRNRCIFAGNAEVNRRSVFEGHNYVGQNSNVKNTSMGFGAYMGNDCDLSDGLIGKYVSIGHRVCLISGRHPLEGNVSTHPAFYSKENCVRLSYCEKPMEFTEYKYIDALKHKFSIGNDVWIGTNVLIMEGVSIGNGAVIGAGALVLKNVPPYAVVAGVPAKIIRYRFSEDKIEKLERIQWWGKGEEWIKENWLLFSNVETMIIHENL